jgi:hypothetical protein
MRQMCLNEVFGEERANLWSCKQQEVKTFLTQFPLSPAEFISKLFSYTSKLAIRRANFGLGSMVIHLSCSLSETDNKSACHRPSVFLRILVDSQQRPNVRTFRIPLHFIFMHSFEHLFNDLIVNLKELPDNRRLRRHLPNDLPTRFLV